MGRRGGRGGGGEGEGEEGRERGRRGGRGGGGEGEGEEGRERGGLVPSSATAYLIFVKVRNFRAIMH